MNRSERFEFRCDREESQRLRQLAERAGRTPSDLLRLIVRQLDVAAVTTGLPLPTKREVDTSECEAAVA